MDQPVVKSNLVCSVELVRQQQLFDRCDLSVNIFIGKTVCCTHFIKLSCSTRSVYLIWHVIVSIHILALFGIDKLYPVHIRSPVSLYQTPTDVRQYYYY